MTLAAGPCAPTVSLPLRRYFSLADGRTAALVSDHGRCDFLCLPRFDSPLALAALLDSARGGSAGVGPEQQGQPTARWAPLSRELVLTWPSELTIRCGLLPDGLGNTALVWLVQGRPGTAIRVAVSGSGTDHQPLWRSVPIGLALADREHPDGPGGPLALVVSGAADSDPGGLAMTLSPGGLIVCLGAPDKDGGLPPLLQQAAQGGAGAVAAVGRLVDESSSRDQAWVNALLAGPQLAVFADSAPGYAVEAAVRSLLTLRGLQTRPPG